MQLPQDQGPKKFLEGTIRVSLMEWYILDPIWKPSQVFCCWTTEWEGEGGGGGRNRAAEA